MSDRFIVTMQLPEPVRFDPTAALPANQAAMEKFLDGWYPMGRNMYVTGNGQMVEILALDTRLYLAAIWTPEELRGRGLATGLMQRLFAICSEYGVAIRITVKPFGLNPGMKTLALRRWYKRLGFVARKRHPNSMEWQPLVAASA